MRSSYSVSADAGTDTRPMGQPRALVALTPSRQTSYSESVARRAMRDIEALEADWDGYGALPLSKKVRLNGWNALRLFVEANLVPDVAPNNNGTISFEWEIEGSRAHFQVGKTTYSMYIEEPSGKTHYFSGQAAEVPGGAISALRRVQVESGTGSGQSMSRIDFGGGYGLSSI